MIYLVLTLIMLLAMAVSLAIIGTIFKIGLGPYIKNRRQPLSSAQASVVSKREEMAESFSHNFDRRFGEDIDPTDAVRMEPVEWFAIFQLEDGEERQFSISQPVYESLIVDDRGQLTWQGDAFIGFTLPSEDLGQPRREVPDDWK
jgi:hypothetical protein